MVAKKIVVGIFCAALISAATFVCLLNPKKDAQVSADEAAKQVAQQKTPPQTVKKEIKNIADMYNSTVYDLPLYSIVEISRMPKVLKEAVDKALEEAQGFYLLKYDEEEQKAFIILQNQLSYADAFSRHNLEFMELYLNAEDGKVLKNMYSPAYLGQDNERFIATYQVHGSDEAWVVDNQPSQTLPVKHTIYSQKNKVKFQEIWTNDETKDIKYQLKGASKNILSMLKEYKVGDDGLRKEHSFYDSEGNLMLSLTVNYEGANVTRMMFYNKHNLEDSMSIISHYAEGLKAKEEVYNGEYKLLNTVEAEYKDGERSKIKLLDSDGNIVTEIEK